MADKKYIERNKAYTLAKKVCKAVDSNTRVLLPKIILDLIDDLPAADVRPVVRGKWKDAMQSCHDSPHVKCSVCGEYYWRYFKKFNFCPNCGADMREET